MELQAELVHAEPGVRVVLVRAVVGPNILGSALGEAGTAEEAEDRARARLLLNLEAQQPTPNLTAAVSPASRPPSRRGAEAPPTPTPAQATASPPSPTTEASPEAEPPPDPDDWSTELAQLDLQLKRLGWGRDQEATYLERAFGHPSRSRLTTYADFMAYLHALEGFGVGSDPASTALPLRRSDLLSQCDQLLGQLQWDAGQGRRFLEQHFSLSSRQLLSDSQLLNFNMLLESELIGL